MLIRSQGKTMLINLSNIANLYVGVNTIHAFYDASENDCIAKYSSHEKAIKVLDMIEQFYNECFAFSMEDDGYYHDVRVSKVFQMPADSEV